MDDLLREALGIFFSDEVHTCTVPLNDARLHDVVSDGLIERHRMAGRGNHTSIYSEDKTLKMV